MEVVIVMNINNRTDIGLCILDLINSLKTQYGKTTLSKILHGDQSVQRRGLDKNEHYASLHDFSQEQISCIIQELIDKGYLQNLEIGAEFRMIVVGLADKGLEAIESRPQINLNVPKVYTSEFASASDIGILDKGIIDEFYQIKVELSRLLKKEESLKQIIKERMISNSTPKICTDKMDLSCKRVERIHYPKEKIEEFVPKEIIEKIKTTREIIVLSVRLR